MKCLRCGTDRPKRLVALIQPGRLMPTEFYVCYNRKACRTRQIEARPVKMVPSPRLPKG